MLLRNYISTNQLLGRQFGGTTQPVTYLHPEVYRNFYLQVENNNAQIVRDSFPTGTTHPYSISMGSKGGLLSSTTMLNGVGTLSPYAVMGVYMEATLDGTSDFAATATAIVQLAAELAGSGQLTADMVGVIQMAATLDGSGTLTAALKALVSMNATLAGSSSMSPNLTGVGSMSANIFVNSGTATTNELVAAIWNAVAADNNTAGTMGQKLNGAGSAGDPWSTNLPSSYADGQAGKILAQIQTLVDELHKIRGLDPDNPWTVTPTGESAGAIDISITGDGVNSSTATRQ
jgi:hypothetical protein